MDLLGGADQTGFLEMQRVGRRGAGKALQLVQCRVCGTGSIGVSSVKALHVG